MQLSDRLRVPVRIVAARCRGDIGTAGDDPPKDNASFWTGSYLKMKVVSAGEAEFAEDEVGFGFVGALGFGALPGLEFCALREDKCDA